MTPIPGIRTVCAKCGGNLAEVQQFKLHKNKIVFIQARCPYCGPFTKHYPKTDL